MNDRPAGDTLTTTSTHPWLQRVHVASVEGPTTPLAEEMVAGILQGFARHGHAARVQDEPDERTDAILTTARFGESLAWRDALLFTARQRFNLSHTPTVYTVIHVRTAAFEQAMMHFWAALEKEAPDPHDFDFPGLAPQAYRVLHEQGRRGGPILAVERLVQAQAKSVHVLLVIGDRRPQAVYHFDLVGAHPRSAADRLDALYDDVVLRMVTKLSTREIADHEARGEPIPRALWDTLRTPAAMVRAAREFGRRDFFTTVVHVADLVHVPAVGDAVAEQYSEGCFATWEPALDGLIATVTGSARPVAKDDIDEDDLAVIVGVRADGAGALVRHVEGKRNDPPSSEAVEMMLIEQAVPMVPLGPKWQVPAVRSILHGHRGIGSYDPTRVEYVPLAPAYHDYPVSCATEAQAQAARDAFARSEALHAPDDPRSVVFTVLPGHGVIMVEKWVPTTGPFQVIWECLDAGFLTVASRVPQGPFQYIPDPEGRKVVQPT